MPNWCYNNLRVETADNWSSDTDKMDKERNKDKKELAKFKKENFKKVKPYNLTFEGSVPMPKELEIDSGTTTDVAIALLTAKKKDYNRLDKLLDYEWTEKESGYSKNDAISRKRELMIKYLEGSVDKDALSQGKQALENIKKYGCKDWYNWRIRNWGTKWDACEGGMNDSEWEIEASFDTAWAPPTPWLEKVSAKYKRLKFTLEYTEEGMGFEGKAFARDGEMEDNCMQVNYPDRFFD